MKNKNLTVCIPTCYGEYSLVTAVESIRNSGGDKIEIIVLADSVPLSDVIKDKLNSLNVKFKENKNPSSQIAKIKQLLGMVKTEYVVFTQDDISITKSSIPNILQFLDTNKNVTMFTIFNETTKPKWFVAYALIGGVLVDRYLERNWNNGQNFLNGDGRFLGFKTEFLRKFRIPEGIINVDTYFYFENKRNGGIFKRCNEATVFYTLPNTLKEQIKKSSRYQYYNEEMQRYFSGIDVDLQIPLILKIKGLFYAILTKPLNTACYFPLLVITRLFHENKSNTKNVMWEVDLSTK